MELTAFETVPDSGFILEPAPLERVWMDQSHSRFAYRCLPLVMANQAGWVVRCPVGLGARWIPTDQPDKSVEVVFDAEPTGSPTGPPAAARWSRWVSSHFGSGILTFSLPWLFRTPRPMCLRVSGPPNWWKEGAFALEGLVETFWSPYTFTMNWKLLKPRQWVRFEKGDPICFLQPLDPAAAEELTPRFRPLADNPQLKAELEAWMQARTQLIHDPNRGQQWQKNYYQGQTMSGREDPQHRSRLQVKPFETATGPADA